MEGERWVTSDSSARGSNAGPDLLRMRRDIGLRKVSLDFDFVGAAVGVDYPLEFPVSFSLIPLSNDVWDLE